MKPMSQFLSSKYENNNDNKNNLKLQKEYDQLLDSYIQNIDENNIKNILNEYKIKITEDNENAKAEIYEKGKLKKKLTFEIMNNINKDLLDEEDIFFIVKNMYDNFKLINRNKYDLEIEKTKLELKKIIDKIIFLCKIQKNNSEIDKKDNLEKIEHENIENTEKDKDDNKGDNENKDNKNNIININNKEEKNNLNIKDNFIEISQEEVDYLCKYMNNTIYQKYFLIKINNFRTLGIFGIPENIFNYMKQIFSEISKNLMGQKEQSIYDVDIAKLMIILSQTFYYKNNGKKVYIQKEIKSNNIFHQEEFWNQIIESSIKIELKKVLESSLKCGNIDNEKSVKERRNNVAFAQIIPNLGAMTGFGLNKDFIIKIISPFIDEYGVSDKENETIFNIIENNPISE